MKYSGLVLIFVFIFSLGYAGTAAAADVYHGDSAIYGAGGTVDLRPNVLFIIDTNQSMNEGALGDPYDPAVNYAGSYTRNAIYRRISSTGGTINYDDPSSPFIAADPDSDADGYGDLPDLECGEAKSILSQTSYYTGPLQSSGACRGKDGFYYTGNLLNYITNPPDGDPWAANTTYQVGDWVQVTDSSTNVIAYYEVVSAGNSGGSGSEPDWTEDLIVDNGVKWKRAGSVLDMVKDAIELVVELARPKAKFGVMVYGANNRGGRVVAEVKEMSSDDTLADDGFDGDAVYTQFLSDLENNVVADTVNVHPINEALYDARTYFNGTYNSATLRMGTDAGGGTLDLASPIECDDIQPNFTIVLTMGATNSGDTATENKIGDQDLLYQVGHVDDAAKLLHHGNFDGTTLTPADPVINTHVIKLINDEPGSATDHSQSALRRAADYGGGSYYLAQNSNDLAEALLDSMNNIMLDADSSFVAPVVPTSPENRTYSGERVYLGFFQPQANEPWYGNLKKFGINTSNEITDKDGVVAIHDSGSEKGSFKSTAKSFWNDIQDAGRVDVGGAGEVLLGQVDTDSRKIYTWLGNNDIANTANAFTVANKSAFQALLGLNDASAEADDLIKWVRGIDTYDDDGDTDKTDTRTWVLGDILHSKPQVVNYNHYTFNSTNEQNCSTNKTMIFVGANDGMLHAFRDCNGEEAWAFIPTEFLPRLKMLPPEKHSAYNTSHDHPYFVDGSPVVYTYDADGDGNIGTGPETGDTDPTGVTDNGGNDKVLLIFGLRRGGNAYYALDVTNPEDPQLEWRIDSTVDLDGDSVLDYGELAQTWSTPHLGTVKYVDGGSTKIKMAAFIGAGYDNLNEDGRFGATQRYSDADVSVPTDDGGDAVSDRTDNDPSQSLLSGYVTRSRDDSSDTVTNDPRGRAVYAIEIADLTGGGTPSFTDSGERLWEFGYPANGNGTDNSYNRKRFKYSVASDVTILDTDFDGYIDRLYVGDTGGQIWRISSHYTTGELRPYANPLINGTDNWFGKRIFEANAVGDVASDAGAGPKGKKFFYRPSVTLESGGVVRLYIGSGDRAHPLNTNVVDRLYGLIDRGQRTNELITEDELVDVTDNILQKDTTSSTDITNKLAELYSTSKYGWYIELEDNAGEKVLAAPLAFNKVAYYTTYGPDTSPPPDECSPGNLGASRLYAVDYKTGEAVLNFANEFTANDNDDETTAGNARAESDDGNVLRKEDRVITLGKGIPSGLVVLMPPSGDAKLLIGCGGGLCSEDPVMGGTIIPIYWMQW